MRKERKIALGIFSVAVVMGVLTTLVSRPSGYAINPFAKGFNLRDILGFSVSKPIEKKSYDKVVYGYLPYWVLDQTDHLQYEKLTDIAYFGLYLESDGKFRTEDENGDIDSGYNKWLNSSKLDSVISKSKKSGVRFALTVIAHEDESIDEFLNCRACWDVSLTQIVDQLDFKGIKDVNLNFEHAEYTDSDIAAKFAEYAKFVNESLDSRFAGLGGSFVTVAAFADSAVKPRVSSDLDALARNTDGIFIMAYDFHRPSSERAGPVAPLGGRGVVGSYDLKTMMADYLSQAPPNKLILGVPYYGYNWVVEAEEPYAARIEGNDSIGYSESQMYDVISSFIEEKEIELKWDELAQVPFYFYISEETGSLRSVYFENQQSLAKKYGFANENGLLGVGIWALGYDGDRDELWVIL